MADDDRPRARPGLALSYTMTLQAAPPAAGPAPQPPLPPARLTVERGADPGTLVIAFTGFGGRLSMPAFDFLGVTGLLRYSRILLRDASRTLFLGGVPPIAADLAAMLATLRAAHGELAPRRTLAIGNSGGSHAAILCGHLLGVDTVHAFAPFTNLTPSHVRSVALEGRLQRHGDVADRLEALPADVHRHFDLRNVLAAGNGRTRFHVHACAQSSEEMRRAAHIAGLPGVTVHRHPCSGHGVVAWLARNERLVELLADDGACDPASGATSR
jgi:hypothetical protein